MIPLTGEQTQTWREPPLMLRLAADEVHVWQAPLDLPDDARKRLERYLAPDERQRADRFRFEHDRQHFVAARGLLRAILGRYLDAEPGELAFRYSPYGKPSLASRWAGAGWRFNLAHSGALALYAVTRGREVGIDLEVMRPDFAGQEIAERFFSRGEVETLRGLPEAERTTAFYACWTRKEAYIKARGEGLSLPLACFDVSLAPGQPAALLAAADPAEVQRWSLWALDPRPGYAAALAAEGKDWRLVCWQWDVAALARGRSVACDPLGGRR